MVFCLILASNTPSITTKSCYRIAVTVEASTLNSNSENHGLEKLHITANKKESIILSINTQEGDRDR